MAVEPDPLSRALQAAREEEPPDWPGLSRSIQARVRSLKGPGEPVAVFDAAGALAHDAAGSRTFVSTRVLGDSLRRRLERPTHAPEDLRIVVVDGRLERLEVELVVSYGQDLLALGAAVRADLGVALTSLVGRDPGFDTDRDITVSVVDVVLGDPTL